jgi:hypothetical protein
VSVLGPDGTRWPPGTLRALEHESIRGFVYQAACDEYLSGRVLDWGCGKKPYREMIEKAGGHYEGYDLAEFPANVSGEDVGSELFWDANAWDAILCTQVVQYVPFPELIELLADFRDRLFDDGHLVMTYPTNWPEVEGADLHRFTKAGMERMLTEARFEILEHECRGIGAVSLSGDEFAVGYGVIARRG